MSRRVMMIALARAMNASTAVVRFSVQARSILKPRLCHAFVRSITHRAPDCSGVPFWLITQSQPRIPSRVRVLPLS